MDEAWLARLRKVSVSQGIMLETASDRLSERGGAHFGSPDKVPAVRLATLEAAGRARVPFTTGILIGIGETRAERIEALLAIRDLHERYGHIQEIIVQNFRAKPGTRMSGAAEPSLEDQVWTIAVARLIFGPAMNIQAPPNLRPEGLAAADPGRHQRLGRRVAGDARSRQPRGALAASGRPRARHRGGGPHAGGAPGDLSGVHLSAHGPSPGSRCPRRCGRAIPSPVRPDDLQPRRQAAVRGAQGERGRKSWPHVLSPGGEGAWIDPAVRTPLLRQMDAAGLAREDRVGAGRDGAAAEAAGRARRRRTMRGRRRRSRASSIASRRARGSARPTSSRCSRRAGADFAAVCRAADRLRAARVGDTVTYVVNRNINYTNICTYGCKFCAFSKGRHNLGHRDTPYDLDLEEIANRTAEAWERGATEVCLQGGIKPELHRPHLSRHRRGREVGGARHARARLLAAGDPHRRRYAEALALRLPVAAARQAGLASLPGTAAEILDDEVRAVLCPDKINTAEWLEVMETAHAVGLRSTATIMFGHVDGYRHWARHLLRVRALQERTGGFTEFVPLPFVHMEAPIYLKGQSRKGPTFREAVLMHAVARLALDPRHPQHPGLLGEDGPRGRGAAASMPAPTTWAAC